ncbi:hypothetical protein SDJN03_19554, partial [Cucurbita argyrosperma subsp. sororia]
MCPLTFLQKFLGTLCLSSGDIHPQGSLLQGQLALQDGDAGQSSDDFSWADKLAANGSAVRLNTDLHMEILESQELVALFELQMGNC